MGDLIPTHHIGISIARQSAVMEPYSSAGLALLPFLRRCPIRWVLHIAGREDAVDDSGFSPMAIGVQLARLKEKFGFLIFGRLLSWR